MKDAREKQQYVEKDKGGIEMKFLDGYEMWLKEYERVARERDVQALIEGEYSDEVKTTFDNFDNVCEVFEDIAIPEIDNPEKEELELVFQDPNKYMLYIVYAIEKCAEKWNEKQKKQMRDYTRRALILTDEEEDTSLVKMSFDEYDRVSEIHDKLLLTPSFPTPSELDIMERDPKRFLMFADFILSKKTEIEKKGDEYGKKNLTKFVTNHLELH